MLTEQRILIYDDVANRVYVKKRLKRVLPACEIIEVNNEPDFIRAAFRYDPHLAFVQAMYPQEEQALRDVRKRGYAQTSCLIDWIGIVRKVFEGDNCYRPDNIREADTYSELVGKLRLTRLELAEKLVLEEIREFESKNPHLKEMPDFGETTDVASRYLNNFRLKIAFCNSARFKFERIETTLWHRTYGEIYRRNRLDPISLSELMRSKTPAEFFSDVDRCAEESGLDYDAANEMIDTSLETNSPLDYIRLTQMIMPVFIRLLAMGYKPKDLRG